MPSVFGFFGRTFKKQPRVPIVRAKTLNGPIDAVNDLHRRRVSSGLVSIEVAGMQNERVLDYDETYARLIAPVGSSGAYTWQGIVGTQGAPNVWIDQSSYISDNGGVDLAYEINKNPNLAAATRVHLKREDSTNAYVFLYDTCNPTTLTQNSPKSNPQSKSTPPLPRGLFAIGRGTTTTGHLVFTSGNTLQQQIPLPPNPPSMQGVSPPPSAVVPPQRRVYGQGSNTGNHFVFCFGNAIV